MALELQLICHGSMAIFYRRPHERGLDYDGYTIFIPQPPREREDDKCPQHELKMGVNAGAAIRTAPQLKFESTNPVGRSRSFELQFGWEPSPKKRGPKPPHSALGLYAFTSKGPRAKPQEEGDLVPPGVAFAIDIPYPHREEVVRVANYPTFPFEQGRTVQHFGLRTTRLIATRVFSYQLSAGTRGVYLQNERSYRDRWGFVDEISASIKIHLYNQSQVLPLHDSKTKKAKKDDVNDHNDQLNQAFRIGEYPLDLRRKQKRTVPGTMDPEGVPIPAGLGFRDLLHLAELYILYPELRHCAQDLGANALKAVEIFQGFDPAECTQPDGCPTDDPPPLLTE
jgi:hypothetical protein